MRLAPAQELAFVTRRKTHCLAATPCACAYASYPSMDDADAAAVTAALDELDEDTDEVEAVANAEPDEDDDDEESEEEFPPTHPARIRIEQNQESGETALDVRTMSW